jgi:hypothetical protein
MTEQIGGEREGLERRDDTPKSPPSPGAASSPQKPGMVPDRSSVPGHFSERVSRATGKRRPLTQYGTAEELVRVFKQKAEEQIVSTDFEQAPASFEEERKAHLWQLPPDRPAQPTIVAGEQPEALPSTASS